MGRDIYEKLIKGYTEKQWGRDCKDLPAFIIKRLPVRLTFDNNYFNALYQGIPIGGYMVSVVDSLVAPLSVINALVVALCLKCPEQVRKNLETLEETWNNYQVYLNDEIDFIDDEPMLDYSLRRKEK